MKVLPSDIIYQAKSLGICDKADDVETWSKLAILFFSPQGREFCEKNKYPSLYQWQNMDCKLGDFNIHVDKGNISIRPNKTIAVIGNTCATINISENEYVVKLIVMHGAKAIVNASNYTVILPVIIDGEIELNKDQTVVIL